MAILTPNGVKRTSYNQRLRDLHKQLETTIRADGLASLSRSAPEGTLLAIEQFDNLPAGQEANAAAARQGFFGTIDDAKANVADLFKKAGIFGDVVKYSKTGTMAREGAEYEPENKDLAEGEELTDAQKLAGAVTAVAAHDPAAYAAAALTVLDTGSCVNAAANIEGTVATEAYSNENVTEFLPFSIIYNTLASRQGPLAEAFFATQVLTPDTGHVAVSVTRSVLMNDFRHKDSGRPVDLKRVNLADAALDPSILARHATRMIPVYQDTVNDHNFHPDFVPVPAVSDGQEVQTAPLLTDIEIDFTGLCQAGMAHNAGEGDWSDTIANPVYLKTAYYKITSKAGKESIVGFPLNRQARSIFSKKTQGQELEMGLQFLSNEMVLSATTKDKDGAPAEALDFLRDPANAGRFLRFRSDISGTAALNTGTIIVNSSKGLVKSLFVEQNGVTSHINDDVELQKMKDEIKSIELVAHDIDANRSNLNRAQRGDLTDTLEEREMYAVGLGTPVTAITPTTDTRSTTDLLGPITATRLRNDNDAITKLYDYSAKLQEVKISYDKHLPRSESIEGIARLVIQPFYERIDVSVLDMLNNIRTADKQPDVQMTVVNLLREVLYRAYRDSNYETALRMQTGVENEKPTVIIGTDTVLANHLIIQGDNRLAGLNFEAEIYTSVDRRLGEFGQDVHDMFVTFTRHIPLDPMSFGTFLWMPELATTLQVSREGGRTNNEVMVQPRCTHIIQLPILIHITIRDLGIALTQKTSIDFQPV